MRYPAISARRVSVNIAGLHALIVIRRQNTPQLHTPGVGPGSQTWAVCLMPTQYVCFIRIVAHADAFADMAVRAQ